MTEYVNLLMSSEIDKIAKALTSAQSDIAAVKKTATAKINDSRSYKYATLDSVYEAIKPALKANGLSVVERFEDDCLHSVLLHESGQWIDYGKYFLGQSVKHQERGSAITYGRRYTLSCMFGIAAEEDDDGAVGNDIKKEVPRAYGTAAESKRTGGAIVKAYQAVMDNENPEAEFQRIELKSAPIIKKLTESGNESDKELLAAIDDARELTLERMSLL